LKHRFVLIDAYDDMGSNTTNERQAEILKTKHILTIGGGGAGIKRPRTKWGEKR